MPNDMYVLASYVVITHLKNSNYDIPSEYFFNGQKCKTRGTNRIMIFQWYQLGTNRIMIFQWYQLLLS